MEATVTPEQSLNQKAEAMHALASGPLASSISRLSVTSRAIPCNKDFHFFYNFPEFKTPIKQIAEKSELLLEGIGSSSPTLFGKQSSFPDDLDDLMDWIVNINDELLERFDVSVDEFKNLRQREEQIGQRSRITETEEGFHVVYGKKKKKKSENGKVCRKGHPEGSGSLAKSAYSDKKCLSTRSHIPFHIPFIPRPQDEYSILVNNTNKPFEHVWLQKSEDGGRFIHPLENLCVLNFVHCNIGDAEPVKPPPIDCTPFILVETVGELKDLAHKLYDTQEFAIDLEHNQYRTFQGLTCLMQISTRTEDFIVDTLKLRVHIGPHLREVFKDPCKRKVMHGADKDILWLQRDFGIYVCNLFDTGQASRVLQLERNSLKYLLYYFCGVTANKEYQNADWRLRPLPEEMIKYAREDTHYLLYIYDLMRARLLLSESSVGETLLLEVYQRSYDTCMQLYEKELLTDTTYLHIYGLQEAGFNHEQLAAVAGLCEWRDAVARAEDESTGYILPNRSLLEIAKQLPLNASKLHSLVKSKHPYVDRNIKTVIDVIKRSIANAPAFKAASEQLKKEHEFVVQKKGIEAAGANMEHTSIPMGFSSALSGQIDETNSMATSVRLSEHVARASVQSQKNPSRAFGAMFANLTKKRNFELEKTEGKLQQIKSSLSLPFHSFSGGIGITKAVGTEVIEVRTEATEVASDQLGQAEQANENFECNSDPSCESLRVQPRGEENDQGGGCIMESEEKALANMSSDLEDCFRSLRIPRQQQRAATYPLDITPFDYSEAKKQIHFGEDDYQVEKWDASTHNTGPPESHTFSSVSQNAFQQPRRRLAFPSTGNRSATFRN